MKHSFTSTLAAAIVLLSATPLASAAYRAPATPVVPAVEPASTGLVIGRNPEWSDIHKDFYERANAAMQVTHEKMHTDMEERVMTWKDQWAEWEGTEQYDAALRDLLQEMNARHRAWHRSAMARIDMMEQEETGFVIPESAMEGNGVAMPVAPRRYDPSRPSRRSIVDAAEARALSWTVDFEGRWMRPQNWYESNDEEDMPMDMEMPTETDGL